MPAQAYRKGEAKSTYGTSAFIPLNTNEGMVKSNHGLLSTMNYNLGSNAPIKYVLEGPVSNVGAMVKWLRDILGLISNAKDTEALTLEVASNCSIYFISAFNELLSS